MTSIDSTLEGSANSRFSSDYREGVNAALDQLRTWKASLPRPPELAQQLQRGISDRSGEQQAGFSETIAAYLWGVMDFGEPYLDVWNPLDDIAEAGVSHG